MHVKRRIIKTQRKAVLRSALERKGFSRAVVKAFCLMARKIYVAGCSPSPRDYRTPLLSQRLPALSIYCADSVFVPPGLGGGGLESNTPGTAGGIS